MTTKRQDGRFEERLTHSVIGAFFVVHRELGFGYREFIYKLALERELVARGYRVDREVPPMVFGREPKFYRTICENRFKTRSKGPP